MSSFERVTQMIMSLLCLKSCRGSVPLGGDASPYRGPSDPCGFPVAAVTDLQTWWLKTTHIHSLAVWKSDTEMGPTGQGCALSGGSRGETIPLPFPASRDAAFLSLWPLLHLQSPWHQVEAFSNHTSAALTFSLLFPITDP